MVLEVTRQPLCGQLVGRSVAPMRNTITIVASFLLLAACAADAPSVDDVDAGPTPDAAAPACGVPSWRAIECRVLCGSVELDAPAMCPGSDSFGDCFRECYTLAPAGHYCPLAPM